MVVSQGSKETGIRSYLTYYDSTAGHSPLQIETPPVPAPALTPTFQEFKFLDPLQNDGQPSGVGTPVSLNFLSTGVILRHDGGADIEFSRDGNVVEGRLEAADSRIVLDNYRGKSIWLRAAAAADYRLWAW